MSSKWDELPLDLLAHIFSFLPPTSIARAMLACKHWLSCARSRPRSLRLSNCLVSMPSRGTTASPSCCYVHEPDLDRWRALSLDFLPCPLRLVASVGSILLCKLASSTTLRLALLNPFSRHFRLLPDLIVPRSNPVVGVVARRTTDDADTDSFSVIVAGGATGAGYEATIEMYDSRRGKWYQIGPMPMEFAVRLTVWTPNESVHAGDGVMYWVTSARAYSVVGFDIERGTWRELKVPMADKLEWAALVLRSSGRLGLAGGSGDSPVCLWELREGGEWEPVSTAPAELARRFFAQYPRQSSTRCVGDEEGVYLFRELGSEILVWRAWHPSVASPSGERKWEWRLVGGGGGGGGSLSLPNIPIKAALLLPPLPCFQMR